MNRLAMLFAALLFPSAVQAAPDEVEVFRERLQAIQSDMYDKGVKSDEVIENDELYAYVEGIVDRLNLQIDREIRVVIWRSNTVNAWVNSVDDLNMTSSLLALMGSEDQLAAVLAHELAHIELDHVIDGRIRQKKELESINRRSLLAVIKATAQSARYSREQETEADSRAIALLHEAGYDASEAEAAMRRLAEIQAAMTAEYFIEDEELRELLELIFSSHPHSLDRADAIKEQVAELDTSDREPIQQKYWEVTAGVLKAETERSRLMRDGSRIRVYLTGAGAQERLGADYYFLITEAYRLDGSDEERNKSPQILAAVINKYPDHIDSRIERTRWLHNLDHKELANTEYQVAMQRAGSWTPNIMDYVIGGAEPEALEPIESLCEKGETHTAEKARFVMQLPCEWKFSRKGKWFARSSRNTTSLEQVWAYFVSDEHGYEEINEKVPEDGASLLELLEMHRADLLKSDDRYYLPGPTGMILIDGREWAWFDYTWRSDNGIRWKSRRYITRGEDGIIGLGYVAPELRYYETYFPKAIEILRGFRILEEEEEEG